MVGVKKTSDKEVEELLGKKLSLTAFAKVVGVPPQFITKAQNDGALALPDDGYFVFGPALRAWQQWKDRSKSSVRAEDDSKIRKMKIRQMELEEAEKRGELVPFPAYREWSLSKIGRLAAIIASLPPRYTRDMPERKRLQKLIEEVFDQFHKELQNNKPS